jgi:hypothetical protein
MDFITSIEKKRRESHINSYKSHFFYLVGA